VKNCLFHPQVAGVCTSLGLGTIQITAGAKRLGWMDTDLTEDEETNKQVLIIWVITLIATASVVSGLSVGVKLLSQIGFGLGLALLFLCLVMENTKYIFNLTVQTTGYYFQYCIFQIPFWTDAFGQLAPGEGRSEEGAAETWWMGSWTVFYMAWWTGKPTTIIGHCETSDVLLKRQYPHIFLELVSLGCLCRSFPCSYLPRSYYPPGCNLLLHGPARVLPHLVLYIWWYWIASSTSG